MARERRRKQGSRLTEARVQRLEERLATGGETAISTAGNSFGTDGRAGGPVGTVLTTHGRSVSAPKNLASGRPLKHGIRMNCPIRGFSPVLEINAHCIDRRADATNQRTPEQTNIPATSTPQTASRQPA